MDSRIREIEQWIAEAKQDLGECGREAYISKLYLLDAEIRAIIKEDGSLPAANSPRQQVNNVRRRSLPTTAFATVVGLLIVAASTVYFTSTRVPSEILASAAPSAGISPAVQTDSAAVRLTPAAYVPQSIPGEEILPFDWEPPAKFGLTAASQPVTSGAVEVIAAKPGGTDVPPVTATKPPEAPMGAKSVARQVAQSTNEATLIALTRADQSATSIPVENETSAANPHTSAMGGEIERTVATEVPTESPEEVEAGDDSGFYEEWHHVDIGDKSIEELADELENGDLELNSTELAKKLRETLDKKKD